MNSKHKLLAHFTDFNHTPERKAKNTFGALGYYRIYKPSQQLKKFLVDVKGTDIAAFSSSFEKNWEKIFQTYDLVWIMHFISEQNASAQAYLAETLKKKLVYDLDDNYLDLPESNLAYEKFQKGKRERAVLSATLSLSDAMTVSTEPLKERMQAHFRRNYQEEKPIFVIPNMNDIADWNFTPAEKRKDRIVIGYSGSNSHQDDLKMVFPVIAKLMKKYSNLYFEFIGSIPKDLIPQYLAGAGFTDDCLNRIAGLASTATFWEYPEYLAQQRWDIGIAPLVDTSFTRSKSHIKWMEYSMYRIPVVASRVYPYFMDLYGRKTITDGETGLLCRTRDEWETKLEALILDESLRKRLGENAYEHIKDNWQYKDFDFDAVFQKILDLPKKPPLFTK